MRRFKSSPSGHTTYRRGTVADILLDTNFLVDIANGLRSAAPTEMAKQLLGDLRWVAKNGYCRVVVPTIVWLEFVDRVRFHFLRRKANAALQCAADDALREPKHFLGLGVDGRNSASKFITDFFVGNDWMTCIDTSLSAAAASLSKALVAETHLSRKDAMVLAAALDCKAGLLVAGDKDFSRKEAIPLIRPVLKRWGLATTALSQFNYCKVVSRSDRTVRGAEEEGPQGSATITTWRLTRPTARAALFDAVLPRVASETRVGYVDRLRVTRGRAGKPEVRLWFYQDGRCGIPVGARVTIAGCVIATNMLVNVVFDGKTEIKEVPARVDGPDKGYSLTIQTDHQSRIDPVVDKLFSQRFDDAPLLAHVDFVLPRKTAGVFLVTLHP